MTVLVFAAHPALVPCNDMSIPARPVQALLGHTASTTIVASLLPFWKFFVFALPAHRQLRQVLAVCGGHCRRNSLASYASRSSPLLASDYRLGHLLFAFYSRPSWQLKSDGDEQIIEQLTTTPQHGLRHSFDLRLGIGLGAASDYYLSWIVRRRRVSPALNKHLRA